MANLPHELTIKADMVTVVTVDSRKLYVVANEEEGYDEVIVRFGSQADGWIVAAVFSMPALVELIQQLGEAIRTKPGARTSANVAALVRSLQQEPR